MTDTASPIETSDKEVVGIDQTAEVVSAYVSQNTIAVSDLPGLIKSVHEALCALGNEEPAVDQKEPAVSIRTSVKPDSIACLECGKWFKSLKRHLGVHHDLAPDEYRAKWNLRPDYPMVAAEYAEARSALAKKLGLGRKAG